MSRAVKKVEKNSFYTVHAICMNRFSEVFGYFSQHILLQEKSTATEVPKGSIVIVTIANVNMATDRPDMDIATEPQTNSQVE